MPFFGKANVNILQFFFHLFVGFLMLMFSYYS